MKGGTFASQINKTKIVSKVLKTGAFFCPIALMPMETIGSTGTVLKKSLDNLLVKAWGV